MKKILLIIALVPLVFVGCTVEPAEQPSELYAKYAPHEGLTVAQVSGFRLNDTVSVDVVLLQADDEAAWQRLAAELGVRPADEGSASWLAEPDSPAVRTAWTGEPVLRVVASPARRTVGLYRLESEVQYDALIDYQLNRMKTDK